jgi:hypothetical protein
MIRRRAEQRRAAYLALKPLSVGGAAAAERYFGHVFKPATPWRFTAAEHLRDAAVGAAIWSY